MIASFLRDGSKYEYGHRVRDYLLYVAKFPQEVARLFPVPGSSRIASKQGSVDHFFSPSEKMLGELRQSGYAKNRELCQKDFQRLR